MFWTRKKVGSEFTEKTAIPVHEEAVDKLNRNVNKVIRRAWAIVKEDRDRDRKIGEFENLMKSEVFNYANWEISDQDIKDLGIREYENTVEKPLEYELPNQQHHKAYDEIADSFIHNDNSMFRSIVTDDIISSLKKKLKANNAIHADNTQRIESFVEAKGTAAQSLFDRGVGIENTLKRIDEKRSGIDADIAAMKSKIPEKKREIERLESDIEVLESLIYTPPVCNDTSKEREVKEKMTGAEVLSVVGGLILSMFTPFIFLAGKLSGGFKAFFKWIGEHSREFNAFIRNISTQPAFWLTIPFAIVNSIIFYHMFMFIFEGDSSKVLLLTAIYTAGCALLPFYASKHLRELRENLGRPAKRAVLIFEGVLVLLAISYPIMAIQYRRIYEQDTMFLIYEAIEVGLFPILTSLIIGFMRYRRPGNTSEIDETRNSAAIIECGTKPMKIPEENDNHKEIIN